jgi:hypothetical protein
MPAMIGTGGPITAKPSGYDSPASYPTEASGFKPPSDIATYPSGMDQDPYGQPVGSSNGYQPPINGTGQQQYYYPNGINDQQYQQRAY